ncbi:MAG: 2-oxoglutarate synthase [Chloroflexi bacterium]|nr:2-oxoglutarate synthase [Chloroflexota bacterium]
MIQAERTTYLNEDLLPMPFCPGCGHSTILEKLDEALVNLQLDPRQVVLVTDIGCQGLSDKYFSTNAFHGLHGRSVTYATGIKLANPDLKVIVLIGDGGCGIGGHHLLNAARRNIGMTVLVFNNLNFGMTGGEHSVMTPVDAVTTTTRYGHVEQPLDICGTVQVNGASFVARSTSFEKDLPDLITQAIQHDGFSLVDIWELCSAYYAPSNRFNKKLLYATMDELGYDTGVLFQGDRPEYTRAYRESVQDQRGKPLIAPRPLDTRYTSNLTGPVHCAVAGAAGKKIGTAAAAFSQGAILSGLWATQRNEYPVTVKTGHSVADVILSREDTVQMGKPSPDVMLVLFPEGLKKEQARVADLSEDAVLYINADLLPVETRARVVPLNFSATRQKKEYWAMMGIAALLVDTGLYPLAAFRDAAALRREFAEKNLAAIDASAGLLG